MQKNSYYQDYFGSILIHKKGKTYKIINVDNEKYYRHIVFIEVEKSAILDIGDNTHGYILENNENLNPTHVMSKFWHKYNHYFISQQEYRKLKIQKLNETRI